MEVNITGNKKLTKISFLDLFFYILVQSSGIIPFLSKQRIHFRQIRYKLVMIKVTAVTKSDMSRDGVGKNTTVELRVCDE